MARSEDNHWYLTAAVIGGSGVISLVLLWCSHNIESHLKGIDSELFSVKTALERIDDELEWIRRDTQRVISVKVIPPSDPAKKKAEIGRLLADIKRSYAELDAIINSTEFVKDRQKKLSEERNKIREALLKLEEREQRE